MVAWFLTAIITVGLFAYIAVTGVGIVTTTQSGNQRGETVRRLDAVVRGLESQVGTPLADGVVYAPAGTVQNGTSALPDDLLPIGVTQFGTRFVYCPMGRPLAAGAGNAVVPSAGGAYDVLTTSLNDRSYVTNGRPAGAAGSDQDVIAFVLAPATPEGTMPGCTSVSRSGDAYVAPNAIVRPLRRNVVADATAVVQDAGNVWYVSTEGRGSGNSPSTPASLDKALAAYRASTGGSFTVVLGAGTYTSAGSLLDLNATPIAEKKEGSALILTSPTSAKLRIGGSINVPGNLEMRNIDSIGSPVVAKSSQYLRLTDSATGPIVAEPRSRVVFYGTNSVRAVPGATAALFQQAGSTVSLAGGALYLQYLTSTFAWYIEAGATSSLSATNLFIQPADNGAANSNRDHLVYGDPGSAFSFRNATINVSGPSNYAFYVAGRLNAFDSTFNMNAPTFVAIQGLVGAKLDLPNVVVRGTSPASYALSSVGGSSITGFGNLYAGNRCWYRGDGSLFRYSTVGAPGEKSLLTPEEDPSNILAAQPTENQIKRYQAIVNRNVERTGIRASLVTPGNGFVCQQASPAVYVSCATENGYCAVPAHTTVRYGLNGNYRYRQAGPEGVPCDNATFGDPLVGTLKACHYLQ